MVVLKDIRNMFWGVTIDGGKRYSQTVERSFHISMAALEPSSAKGPVCLMILHEKAEFLLCTLDTKNIYQQTLDLNFTEGEDVTFFLTGSGIVHLTGYLVEDEEDVDEYTPSMDSDLYESSDEETPELVPANKAGSDIKRKLANIFTNIPEKKKKKHQLESESEESSDDSDDEDFIENEVFEDSDEDSDEDSEEQDEFPSDDEEDDEEEEEEEEEETPPPAKQKSSKKLKQEKRKEHETSKNQSNVSTPTATPTASKSPIKLKSPKVEVTESGEATEKTKKKKKKMEEVTDTGSAVESAKIKKEKIQEVTESGDAPESAKKKKKKRNKKKKNDGQDGSLNTSGEGGTKSKPQTPSTPKKTVVSGGTVVEDIKVGHGPEAKSGKMVHVYYMGKLTSGKQFDSCTSGKPFRFKLGKHEVIKGWDNGVAGMKVGGKRRLTVPAQQGYGNQRQGPIPPNSTLVFEVELKAVS